MSIYDFEVQDAKGERISLSMFRNKVLLIVNTATGCGFTPQYKELEELYERYKEEGFEILDFPCNQFGNQAPGSDVEISDFCQLHYQTKFMQMKKVNVNGEDAIPLYQWLKRQKKGIFGENIKWNFTKFLIDRQGRAVKRFSPMVQPHTLTKDIEMLLR